MKKLCLYLLACAATFPSYADGNQATITSVPSPAVTTKALEITVKTDDFGSSVYCYTWLEDLGGSSKSPWEWGAVHTDKFKMSGSGGTYSLKINSIKDFYELSDNELSTLKKIGFIAKTSDGRQTQDLFLEVVQGRVNVYSGGEGTAESPFIISKAADLTELAATPMDWAADVYLKLGADIDASSLRSSIGSKSSPFKGHFDGAGHTVSNLRLTNDNIGEAAGFFGALEGASVSNLGIVKANVSGQTYVGALAGYASASTISRCFATGTATGTSVCVGGLVGENVSGTIIDCYSDVDVVNDNDFATGGLVGKNTGTVTNTYAAGNVTGLDYVGGIVGANYGTVKSSFALNEKITATHEYGARFGGNNNQRNISTSNYSWNGMGRGHSAWTGHGDHASQRKAGDLADFTTFKSLSGWDFDNVWEWRAEGTKEYPALRSLSNQECGLSQSFFDAILGGVDNIASDSGAIAAWPNPTDGLLNVSAPAAIASASLYSLNGALVLTAGGSGDMQLTLDLGGVAPGMYILHVTTATGEQSVSKIIRK